MPTIVIVLLISLVFGVLVGFTSKLDNAPAYYPVFQIVGFITSILWFYAEANESECFFKIYQKNWEKNFYDFFDDNRYKIDAVFWDGHILRCTYRYPGQELNVFYIIFRSSWSSWNSLNLRTNTFSKKCTANLIFRLFRVWF